jgi:hypothetical protein
MSIDPVALMTTTTLINLFQQTVNHQPFAMHNYPYTRAHSPDIFNKQTLCSSTGNKDALHVEELLKP